jgi:hypothetical protein
MDERRTTEERISTSIVASTLGSREDKLMPVDTLAAVGFAARRADPATLDAVHAYLGLDTGAAADLMMRAELRAHHIAHDMGLVIDGRAIHQAVDAAIARWINPVCPACAGRKYERIKGTPKLSSRMCGPCRGTGLSLIPDKDKDLTLSLISWLKTIISDHAFYTRIKMRDH